jgi:hypothetical protein
MAKWCGIIGFGVSTETKPGVWKEVITERRYYGDIIQTVGRPQGAEQLNDHIKINNRISIVADPFARENFYSIRYATFEGIKWKVSSAEVQYPRLVLDMGEVYNG